ncbi:MAG: hypothetical protein ACFFA2_05660 [Promethearchaeota archaeon]
MDKGTMISGIKRRTTAIESTYRYFQTVDLIVSHFKRAKDREKIFELAGFSSHLDEILIAAASVHLYHNYGIRFPKKVKVEHFSDKMAKDIEIKEKKILLEEIKFLLKNSFNLEIDLINKVIEIEDMFISLLIEQGESNFSEYQKNECLNQIDQKIEYELLEIIKNYPALYFYDFLGDLIGLINQTKREILEESSAFKDLSVDFEKKLDSQEKEDKFIELSSLNRLINRVHTTFEIKSYKELQIHTMPIRMIKKKILEFEFNKYPISIPGLKVFQKGNSIKRKLVNIIKEGLAKPINYETFEEEALDFLKKEILNQLKTNPNDFIYLIQNLYDFSFEEIIYQLNKHGIYEIMHLINVDNNLLTKIKKNMIKYNIRKQDFLALNDKSRNLFNLAKNVIIKLDFSFLKKILDHNETISEFDLSKILYRENLELNELWKVLEKRIGTPINELKEFVRKKLIIEKVFIQELGLNNYDQIITILNFEEIIQKIIKDIFYYIVSKILRQLSRIIESYNKISDDKGLILQALKKMEGTLEDEDWINIKLEELVIKRIMRRQEEFVITFDALNQVFIVNGFIFSRLTDKSLEEGINELRDTPSLIYAPIKSLKFQVNLISPVSYCIAYDIIKRLESFNKLHKLEVKDVIEIEKREEERKLHQIIEKQKESTLNWIERRITSSLMGITRPGINPNQFYWQEKDTKITTDNIKLHSELNDDPYAKFCEYYNFAVDKIRSFKLVLLLPSNDEIEKEVKDIIENTLFQRLNKNPLLSDIKVMLEGERYLIAKKIAIKIGKILDSALYTKFKNKRKS